MACSGSSASQLAAPDAVRCSLALSGPQQTLPSDGASISLALETSRDCSWSAASDAAWVQLSPRSGQGNAALVAVAVENPTPASRTASITVNDEVWHVTQLGAPPPAAPDSSGPSTEPQAAPPPAEPVTVPPSPDAPTTAPAATGDPGSAGTPAPPAGDGSGDTGNGNSGKGNGNGQGGGNGRGH